MLSYILAALFLIVTAITLQAYRDKQKNLEAELRDGAKKILGLQGELKGAEHGLDEHWQEILRWRSLSKLFLPPAQVHKILQDLAVLFQESCSKEEEARRGASSVTSREVLERDVAVRKQSFWDAHELARLCGYKVADSHAAFLPEELKEKR